MSAGANGTLDVREICMSFGSKRVLERVSLVIEPGEIVALVGPSGCGKSTLLSVLTGALTPNQGEIFFSGQAIGERERPLAYMPQRDVLLPWRTISDNAGIGLEVGGLSRRRARQRVAGLLSSFGLAGTEELYPRQLSGGMRQRVSFLRTVIQERPILLLDEPFGALDAITRDELQRWLLEIWALNGWSILLVTHDIREAVRMADRVLILPSNPGPLIAGVTVSREIPRTTGFVTDPRVPPLEVELHEKLGLAAKLR